jgi:radical SAM superfamily enzyme YgiQ (UPF0313 family)
LRILLVKLPEPKRQKPSYMPPIGLWSIQQNSLAWNMVSVLDLHLSGTGALHEVLADGWDAVGISAQFSIQHREYEAAARVCKMAGVVRVIAGGFHAAAVPAPDGVDEVYRGDGECAFRPELRFEDIEYPAPSAFQLSPYWQKNAPHDLQSKTGQWMPVEFSRGCSRHCVYCGVPKYWGAPRYFSREKITAHLDAMVAEGIKEIFIEDDNFISDPDFFEWVIGEIGRRGLYWSTPNGIEAKALAGHVDKLADSGCWRVSLPFETGTEKGAALMGINGKWMPFRDALSLVEDLKSRGIKTCGFFIIGFPGETLEDMRETLAYANALPLDQRNIYIATPYPGTPLYGLCDRKGYLQSRVPELYDDLLYTRGLIKTSEFLPEDVEELKMRDRDEAMKRKAEVNG